MRALAVLVVVVAALAAGAAVAQVPVQGYYRHDGTYVAPYYRTAPDGIPENNYGYRPPAAQSFGGPQIPGTYAAPPVYSAPPFAGPQIPTVPNYGCTGFRC